MRDHYSTKLSADELITVLAAKGLVAPRETLNQLIHARRIEKELPLYLRAIIGVGAFFGSLCFLGFLSAAKIVEWNSATSLIFWGLVFTAVAIGLYFKAEKRGTSLKSSLIIQSSFASMAVGKSLFVVGVYEALDNKWGLPLGSLIITLVTYFIYRMSVDRFLSSLAVLTLLFAQILQFRPSEYRQRQL